MVERTEDELEVVVSLASGGTEREHDSAKTLKMKKTTGTVPAKHRY